MPMNNPNHMHYNVKATGITLAPETHDYLDKKVPHVAKFLRGSQLSVLTVELAYDAGRQDKKYHAVFNIVANNQTMHAEAHGDALHEAIDLGVDELAREASRIKTKRLGFRRHALRVKEFFRGFRNQP